MDALMAMANVIHGTRWALHGNCLFSTQPLSQAAIPVYLQQQLAGTLLNLVLCLHVEHLGSALSVDRDNDITGSKVPEGCFAMFRHL